MAATVRDYFGSLGADLFRSTPLCSATRPVDGEQKARKATAFQGPGG